METLVTGMLSFSTAGVQLVCGELPGGGRRRTAVRARSRRQIIADGIAAGHKRPAIRGRCGHGQLFAAVKGIAGRYSRSETRGGIPAHRADIQRRGDLQGVGADVVVCKSGHAHAGYQAKHHHA